MAAESDPDDTSQALFAVNDEFDYPETVERENSSDGDDESDGDEGNQTTEGGVISFIKTMTPREPTDRLVVSQYDPTNGGYGLNINEQHSDWTEYAEKSASKRIREQTRIASERGFLALLDKMEMRELRKLIYENDDKDEIEQEMSNIKEKFQNIRATVQTNIEIEEVFQ